jgi:hypothetical protein
MARITAMGWSQCDACKLWLREIRTIEEREDEPPEDELDPSVQAQRSLDTLKALREKPRKRDSRLSVRRYPSKR